ncbi:WD repeat-containing protein 74 [Leptidea sinapis]|uniref:WD repeat-containing protein 74 n=1 Tax=Leptidea sinapis TaxID=189913 RepID=UPI0021442E52|nr:WD repeat-containing protein 74 [Leptidea sinapis]
MILTEYKELDFFVGTRIGSFKHIKYHTDTSKNNKKCIENLVNIKTLQKDDTITCMEWGNAEQTEILLGKRTKEVQIYDTTYGFSKSYTADIGNGDIVGLGKHKRKVFAAVASGIVNIWRKKDSETIDVGGKLDRMRLWRDGTMFATGGEENDLKVWKVDEKTAVFVAKNLPHDWLQLRRPVWVTDLTFIDENLLAVCSRHGYVRLYDTRAQRRPVSNVDTQNLAATCISTGFDERQVLVGFGRGQLHQVDFRQNRLDKGYKGAAGAITSVAVSEKHGLIVSTCLDRHLRVHDRDSKSCVYKQYLTSKLSHVLVQTECTTSLKADVKEEADPQETASQEPVAVESRVEDSDLDEVFENMEVVSEKRRKRPLEAIEVESVKPSTEGTTDPEDAIVKLLRSTEKEKRRREKKRREKKAKSVFHNA